MSGGTANRQEGSEERIKPPFPFLRLPGEIRNEIYRLVLLRQNVITEKLNLDHELKLGSQGAGGDGSVQPSEVAVGTIRCDSWRTYTMGYPIAILLTNQQIYREACGIFQLENMWTIIRFNKAGVGKEMKDHGFPVFSASNLWRHFKFPVLKVTIMFPALKDQKQSDTLVVATVHLKQVMRALWTTKGASEMEVVIDVQPPRTKNPRCQHCLLRPFFKLRSVKWLVVLGVSEQGYIDDLTRAITTTDGINQTLGELAAGVQRLQRDINAERWELAIAKAGKHVVLMADCATAYENRQYGIGSDIRTNAAISRLQVAEEIGIATAIVGAEFAIHFGNYANTIEFADRALTLLSRATVFQHVVPPVHPTVVFVVMHPRHQLPSSTSILTSQNEAKCNIALLRARANMGMQRAEDAFADIQTASNLMPNSAKVASVSEDWQVMFGCVFGFSTTRPPPPPV